MNVNQGGGVDSRFQQFQQGAPGQPGSTAFGSVQGIQQSLAGGALNLPSPVQQGRQGAMASAQAPSNLAAAQQRLGTGLGIQSGLQQLGMQGGGAGGRMGVNLGQQFSSSGIAGIQGMRATGVPAAAGPGTMNVGSLQQQQAQSPQPGLNRPGASGLPTLSGYVPGAGNVHGVQQQQQQRGFGGLSALSGGRSSTLGGINTGGYGAPSGDLLTMLNKGVRQPDDAPAFNPSDFPSLSAAGNTQQRQSSQDVQSDTLAALLNSQKAPQQQAPTPAFGEEDFPALPGAGTQAASRQDGAQGATQMNQVQQQQQIALAPSRPNAAPTMSGAADASMDALRLQQQQLMQQQQQQQQAAVSSAALKSPTKQMVATASDNQASDRFGLIGLLDIIQSKDADLSTLTTGIDLTTLGLNLNAREPLWKTFASPWTDGAGKAEPNFKLPPCFLQNPPRLIPAHFGRFEPDALFYIFYGMPGDEAQLFAADELASRGWYYHKELKTWLTRAPNTEPIQKTDRFERGTFFVFDPTIWDVVKKENFTVNYDSLERPPGIAKPASVGQNV